MTRIDPEQERERLAARYAAMSDLELKRVGRDPTSLTEWARIPLEAEMKKRGLPWNDALKVSKPIEEDEILVRIKIYADRNTAGLVRDFLMEKGISAYFLEEQLSSEGETASAKGAPGTQLLVAARDLATARHFLTEELEAELVMEASGNESPGTDRPVLLRRYRDMPEAYVAKALLDDAGIEAFLLDENTLRMDWLWSNALGGIKLVVRGRDAVEAEKLLSEGPALEPQD